MMFADVGDTLTLDASEPMGFTVEGPFAAGLADETDNLVTRARDRLLNAAAKTDAAFGLILRKDLPLASGLGGGSADAAAALRLIASALKLEVDCQVVETIAAGLGSDVPACLSGAPSVATGRGERLAEAAPLPDLDVVLVNPGVASPTGPVYRAYDQAVSPQGADSPAWPPGFLTAADVAAFLRCCRNDLEAPAVTLQPEIGEVLAVLRGQPETLLARMSGSGATCFAICDSAERAQTMADRVSVQREGWWIRRCKLRGVG